MTVAVSVSVTASVTVQWWCDCDIKSRGWIQSRLCSQTAFHDFYCRLVKELQTVSEWMRGRGRFNAMMRSMTGGFAMCSAVHVCVPAVSWVVKDFTKGALQQRKTNSQSLGFRTVFHLFSWCFCFGLVLLWACLLCALITESSMLRTSVKCCF